MDESATEINAEEHRKKWLNRLADEIIKTEKLMPTHYVAQSPDNPQWVTNIERELAQTILPAAKLREPDFKITPKRMGALIGHCCELAVYMTEWFKEGVEDDPIQNTKAKIVITVSEELRQKWEKDIESMFKWYDAMRRLAKLSLCSCVDQTYEDMTDFLLGFADAFSRKPKTFKAAGIGNPTFEIYLIMAFCWRLIVRLNSVRELHEVLVNSLGSQRVGDQKRIEKICERIGLSFRKPGRPKKK